MCIHACVYVLEIGRKSVLLVLHREERLAVGSAQGCFVRENVKRFKTIAWLAYADAVIFPLGMIIVGFLGAGQPGLTVIITPAVVILSVCAARVFQILAKITENASALQEEHDLTV